MSLPDQEQQPENQLIEAEQQSMISLKANSVTSQASSLQQSTLWGMPAVVVQQKTTTKNPQKSSSQVVDAVETEKQSLKAKKKAKKSAARRFFDLEADDGSDNEKHDDRVKRKAKEAGDSDDSDDDDNPSDDSFVDNEAPVGDEVEIAKADQSVRDLFLAKQAEDEQNATQQAYGAVFHGRNAKLNNKKRRYEDLSDESDGAINSIYNQRRAERMQNDQMLLNNEDGENIDLKATMEQRELEHRKLRKSR